MKTERSLRQILSVRCPMCRAKPKERCTLTTGHPCIKTHHARALAATRFARPEGIGQSTLRAIKNTGARLRALLGQK